MSYILDRLTFFNRVEGGFADGDGITMREDRGWHYYQVLVEEDGDGAKSSEAGAPRRSWRHRIWGGADRQVRSLPDRNGKTKPPLSVAAPKACADGLRSGEGRGRRR
jgi:hypothetical protein